MHEEYLVCYSGDKFSSLLGWDLKVWIQGLYLPSNSEYICMCRLYKKNKICTKKYTLVQKAVYKPIVDSAGLGDRLIRVQIIGLSFKFVVVKFL